MDKNCDHLLGELCGDKVTISELSNKLNEIISHQLRMSEHKLLRIEVQTRSGLLDGRKGYLWRFSYCPHCGQKINWKEIISNCQVIPNSSKENTAL